MTNISISELGSFCNSHNLREFVFASYNQEIDLGFDPAAFELHFNTLVTVENDGMVVFKNNEAMSSMSIVYIQEITIDDSMPKLGITICIKCCSPMNSRRIKNYTVIAN